MDYKVLEQAARAVSAKWPDAKPRCGLILGSGWSDVADAFEVRDTLDYEAIPGLGQPGVKGHTGRLVWAAHAGVEALIFQGRRHWYEGEGWTPVAAPIYVLKKLGASIVVITNAAGGVREDLKPGSLMAIDDHINSMPSHPLVGPHNAFWGARFVDQSQVYDAKLRDLLDRASAASTTPVHHGVYLAASGPTYETPAEIIAFRTLGADAVGMSTAPEAVLANAAGLRVLGISCITNWAAGVAQQPLSHDDVVAATRDAMPRMMALLLQLWEEIADAEAGS